MVSVLGVNDRNNYQNQIISCANFTIDQCFLTHPSSFSSSIFVILLVNLLLLSQAFIHLQGLITTLVFFNINRLMILTLIKGKYLHIDR